MAAASLRRPLPTRGAWLPAGVTLALFAAAGAEGLARTHADPSVELDRIRDAVASGLPYSAGDWVGRDVEAAPAAVALLRPSAMVNRTYENLRSGECADLLFVWCGDARDLLGHYPPVCYPAHGRQLLSARPHDFFDADGVTVPGMRYRFAVTTDEGARSEIVVDNVMVLPGGGFGRDMDAIDRVARDVRLRRRGAGEVQLLTDGAMSDERRDEVFRALFGKSAALYGRVGEEVRHE